MVLKDAALNLAELEANDLLERLVAHGVIGDQNHAAEERGLEDLVQIGFECASMRALAGWARFRGRPPAS